MKLSPVVVLATSAIFTPIFTVFAMDTVKILLPWLIVMFCVIITDLVAGVRKSLKLGVHVSWSTTIREALGYYGGAINGVTVYLEYEIPTTTIENYTYTFTVNGDATIVVTIGTAGNKIFIKSGGTWKETLKIYVKVSGTWKEVNKAYKKVNGSWVEQSDKSAMFDPNARYINGI